MKRIFFLVFFSVLASVSVRAQFSAVLDGFPLVTTGWTVGGSSVVVDSTIRLTAPTTTQSGYVYYATPVNLTGCGQFTVDFDYRVQASSSGIADGIAFWYISNPPTGFSTGGGIGLPSFPNGLIMIMDTYDNISPDYVPLATLLGYNGTVSGYVEGATTGQLCPPVHSLFFITDGTWRHCKITYNVGNINVYFNYSTTPTLTGFYPLTITGYFGFSSSTGAVYSTQSIKSVHITAVTALDHPTVTSPITYCQNDVATPLSATGVAGAAMSWFTTDTATVISLPGAPTPSTATPGTYTWYVRQTAGTCISTPDSIKVIVNPQPAAPAISGNTFYCQDSAFVPFTATGTSIQWYTTPTGGTGSSTAPTVPTGVSGNYTYYATQTVSGCESPRDSIKVRVHATTPAPTLTSGLSTYCQYETFVPFVVSGTDVKWYTVPTGGTYTTTASVINTNAAGTYDFYVTQSDSGCESPRLHVPVTVYAHPAAPGVSLITYCQGALAVPLTAAGTGLTWYGPGVTAGYSTAPTPSTALTGTTTYYVTQTINGCEGDSASIVVTIDSTPSGPTIGGSSLICEGDTLFLTSASGTAGVTYSWAGPSSFTSTEQNPIILNATPANSGSYVVTIAATGTCTSSASLSVTVTPTPPLVAGSNSPVCTSDTLKLTADVGAVGGVYTWAGPMSFSSGAQNPKRLPVIPEMAGIYTVSVLYQGCTATVFDTVVIHQNPLSPWMAWPTYCQHSDAPALQAYGDSILWYTASTPGLAGSAIAPIPSTTAAGNTWYFATQTIQGCTSRVDSMLVTINPAPQISVIKSGDACPHDSVMLLATEPTGVPMTYHWYPYQYLRDTTGDTVYTYPETSVAYTVVGTNQYGCKDIGYVHVAVHPGAVMYLPDSVTIYPGETYQIAPQTNATSFFWSPSGGLSSPYISNPLAAPSISTKYMVRAQTEQGCVLTDSISIYVADDALIAMPNAFTPGSEVNGQFRIILRGVASLSSFRIYDRWGQQVFETKDINQGWDGTFKGTPQPFGVYVYEVDAVSMNGNTFKKNGNVTLIR